jgi:hypothetical protein
LAHDLFNANFGVLLCDLTSTYFEINASYLTSGATAAVATSGRTPAGGDRIGGHSGWPALGLRGAAGQHGGLHDARMFLARIERQYGRARRVWVMDRGIPTEAVLAEMRSSDPPVQYLVGTPKGRLSRLEKQLLAKPWQEARPGVAVKLLAEDEELYVYSESVDRAAERAMRRGS